jgi:hypothetical protein
LVLVYTISKFVILLYWQKRPQRATMAEQIDFSEILVAPLAQMIQKIGQGVADAQRALDSSAMETQDSLAKNHPQLAKIGYQVTWYQMPEVVVELKMSLHYEKTGEENTSRTGLFLSPFNAKSKNTFSQSTDGTSTMKLRIVPVPPPSATESIK